VAEAIRAGRLVPALLDVASSPAQLVHPQARLAAPKLHAFVDLAARRLRVRLSTDFAIHRAMPGPSRSAA
jgi:hypothetical protein